MDNWHFAMYCVGVFVTCNVGGYALGYVRDAVSAALMKRHGSADASANAESGVEIVWRGQSLEDMQRQIARPEPDADADPEGGDAS